MSLSRVLRERRAELGCTLLDIANRMGVSEATVQRWESGNIKSLRYDRISKLAEILNVSPSVLMGWEDQQRPQPLTEEFVQMPLIGDLAAGYDRMALEDWDGEFVNIPASCLRGHRKEDFIMLRVTGDSMYPLYQDGDMVLILRQETQPRPGQVCAVLYNDDMSTLKKVNWEHGGIRLDPINPMYQPIEIKGEDMAHFRVIGVPRLLIREIYD